MTDKPEAVAWMYQWPDEFAQTDLGPERYPASYVKRHNLTETPLYAHPPQPDASALVEAIVEAALDVANVVSHDGYYEIDRDAAVRAALSAWEAQHG
jgi:hypothetical protein